MMMMVVMMRLIARTIAGQIGRRSVRCKGPTVGNRLENWQDHEVAIPATTGVAPRNNGWYMPAGQRQPLREHGSRAPQQRVVYAGRNSGSHSASTGLRTLAFAVT